MTRYPPELPHVSSYVGLIDRFIGRDVSAPDFERSFLRAMKSERRTLGDPVYAILQELFEDADAYVEHAELRTEPVDLDHEQLLATALRARHAGMSTNDPFSVRRFGSYMTRSRGRHYGRTLTPSTSNPLSRTGVRG